jgi:mRNA interferase HigB
MFPMHVVSEKKLREFWSLHPDAEYPLRAWHRVAEQSEWEKFADIREAYPSADQVGKFTVFNIGGNKFRLIVVVHFNRGKLYVRHVLTHEEYSRGTWTPISTDGKSPQIREQLSLFSRENKRGTPFLLG